jgi:hypothetical protein
MPPTTFTPTELRLVGRACTPVRFGDFPSDLLREFIARRLERDPTARGLAARVRALDAAGVDRLCDQARDAQLVADWALRQRASA